MGDKVYLRIYAANIENVDIVGSFHSSVVWYNFLPKELFHMVGILNFNIYTDALIVSYVKA